MKYKNVIKALVGVMFVMFGGCLYGEYSGGACTRYDSSNSLYKAVSVADIDLDCLKSLIDAGVDVNALDECGKRPMDSYWALMGDHEALKILVEAGAEYDFKVMLKDRVHDKDPDFQRDNFAYLADRVLESGEYDQELLDMMLFTAAEYGLIDFAEKLLGLGANLHAKEDRGDLWADGPVTIAWCAIQSPGCLPMLEYLGERGADFGYVSETGRNLLHEAALNGSWDEGVVKYLTHMGVDINAKDMCGDTPLDIESMLPGRPMHGYNCKDSHAEFDK